MSGEDFLWQQYMSTDTGTNAPVVAAASLSIVSILGFLGTCLVNHKDTIIEKLRCSIGWNTQPDTEVDLEARQSTGTIPQITLPIVINNHSGEMTLAAHAQQQSNHRRSHSEPTFDTSESYEYDTSPTKTSTEKSSSSSDIVCR